MSQVMLDMILAIFSGILALLGTVTNCLSLSYFVTLVRAKNRPTNLENSVSWVLLILAMFDLLVCTFAAGRVISMSGSPTENLPLVSENATQNLPYIIFTGLLFVSSDTTAFLTCVMSVMRTINLLRPRYKMSLKLIGSSILVYSLIVISVSYLMRSAPALASFLKFFILSLILITVIVSNAICMVKLYDSDTVEWKKRATITVAILSLIFCITNMGYIVICGRFLLFEKDKVPTAYVIVFLYILLPFNSACNPIVYFVRSTKIRRHLRDIWRKFVGLVRQDTTASRAVINTPRRYSS